MTSNIELDPDDGSIPIPVEMNTNITASLISVSLPANGFRFVIDPAQGFNVNRPSTQVTSPDVTAINRSMVPVELEIASVPEVEDVKFSDKSSDYVEQSFQLIDHIPGVEPPGTTILVLGAQDRQYGSSEGLKHYAICPERTGIFAAGIPAEQETVTKLCGRVAPDFCREYELTVKPTLKIGAVRAD